MVFKKRYGPGRSSANPRFSRDDDGDSRFKKRPSGRNFERRSEGPMSRPMGRPRDRRSSGRDSRYGSRLELFDVTCANCGKKTQVPFKPTGEKPVLCRDCFTKPGDAPRESKREFPKQEFSKPASRSSELDEINQKLDKIMAALKIR